MSAKKNYTTLTGPVHRLGRVFALTFFTLVTLFFSSCQFWNEPVRDYFEKWTQEVSIAKYELVGIESYTDKDGNTCISSDQDAPVTLFLINPYHYSNVEISSGDITTTASGTFPTITQDSNDTTLLHFTYPRDFLIANDCGGEIGATINLRHPMNQTSKEYTFNLKSNSRPPEVKGQAVLVSASLGQKYVICFYLPTSELSSDRHINDIHTIFIDDTAIATGTVAQLNEASVDRPSDLTRLSSGTLFDSDPPSGYTPFYYVTNRIMQENDNFSWDIRLEDDDGLCSRTMKASTIVTEAHMSASGGDEIVITTNEGSKTETISAEVDEGIVQSWTWTSNEEDIATVTADANNGSHATITGVSGGMTTISIQAELVDGRVVRSTKTIRVLAISLGEEDSMIVNGDSGALSITPVPTAFTTTPSYTWNSNNTEVATVDSNGNVTAVAHGTAVITASASYGDKLVISSGKTINVYEVSAIQGDNVGFVGTGNEFNVGVQVTAPDGSPVSSFDQTWSSSNTSVAPAPSGTDTTTRTVSPTANGSTIISVEVTVAGKKATRQKTLTIYDLVVSDNKLLSQTGSTNNLTLTPSLKSGSTSYSGSVTYTYAAGTGNNATVSNSGVVTAKSDGDGSETITVTATVNGKTLTKTHTVHVIAVSGNTNFIAGEAARKLTATTKPTGYSYNWSSSNSNRTQVNSSTGMITAITEGSTTITLTVTKLGGSESLAITTPITTYALSIIGNTLYDKTDSAKIFTPSLKNGNIDYPESDITYSWTSGTPANATIDETTGILTPKAGGSTLITLSAKRDGVTVKSVTKAIYVIGIIGCTNFIAGETERALTVADGNSGATLTWGTNDSDKVSVNASSGKINAISNGTATITLTATKGTESLTVSTQITIYTLSIVGNTLYDKTAGAKTFTASLKNGDTAYPDSDISYNWSSGTVATATINGTSGSMTPKAGGSTVITLTVKRNETAVASITKTIYVIEATGCTNFIVGEDPRKLTTTTIPSGYSYIWLTNNSSMAEVNQSTGKIKAKAEGSTAVTLKITKGSEILEITTPITIYSLSISGNTLYDMTAGTQTLTASLKNGGTAYSGSDITFSWSSGSQSTATVTETGSSTTLTPVAGGSSTITLTAKRNGTEIKSVTKTIYVIEVKGCKNFIVGGSARALTVVPASISGVTYTWSSNTTLFTVNGSTGEITANSNGNPTVKLTATNGSETINVNTDITLSNLSVTSPNSVISGNTISIAVGEEFSVTKSLSPSFTYSSMTCSSSNTNIADIDNNFKITGKAQGTSNITVTFTMSDGTSLVKQNAFTINVIQYHTVNSVSELNSFLSNMPANSTGKPYKIKITNLTANDILQNESSYGEAKVGTLRAILKDNSTKYVDLSNTTLPSAEDMSYALQGCSSLIRAPSINNGVKNMKYFYYGCGNLISPVSIPNGVEHMWGTFEDCTSLTIAPELPNSLSGPNGSALVRTFSGCTKLTQAPSTIPSGVNKINWCFYGCSSLTTGPDIPENVTEATSVYQSCKINGTTITVKANLTDPHYWENAFTGNPRVLIKIEATNATAVENAITNAVGYNPDSWYIY